MRAISAKISLVALLVVVSATVGTDCVSAAEAPTPNEASDVVFEGLLNEIDGEKGALDEEEKPGEEADDDGGFFSRIMQTIGVLAIVVGLMLLLSGAYRRLTKTTSGFTGPISIRVLARTSLSPKAKVYLLEVEGRRIVIGEAGGRVNSLLSYPASGEGDEIEEAQGGEGFRDAVDAGLMRQDERGFLDRIMAGIRDLRTEREKLSGTDSAEPGD